MRVTAIGSSSRCPAGTSTSRRPRRRGPTADHDGRTPDPPAAVTTTPAPFADPPPVLHRASGRGECAATSAAQAGGFLGVDMCSGQGGPPPMPSSDEPAQFEYVDDTSVGCDPWGVVGDG
jgi:hypothetical protein